MSTTVFQFWGRVGFHLDRHRTYLSPTENMTMCFMEDWLRENGNIVNYTLNLTTTFQLGVPADPLRFCLIFPMLPAQSVGFGFGFVAPANEFFYIPQQAFWPAITDRELPVIITTPIWIRAFSSSGSVSFQTVSYLPERRQRYDRYINSLIASKLNPL
jgi:hypothetical protein